MQVAEPAERERLLADARPIVRAHRGLVVTNEVASLLAAFDGPARAVRCGLALMDQASLSAAGAGAGVCLAEIPRHGGTASGPGVTAAATQAAVAPPGAVLVSRMIYDLVHGSGLRFLPHGTMTVDGKPYHEVFVARATG